MKIGQPLDTNMLYKGVLEKSKQINAEIAEKGSGRALKPGAVETPSDKMKDFQRRGNFIDTKA